MKKFNEKSAIEDYLVEKLKEKGWKFVPADELERESFEEPILLSLPRLLEKINKSKGIGNEEIKQVLNELKLKSTGIEGNKQILDGFKFGIPVVIIECKNPVSFSTGWFDAYKQIKEYEKTIPELFKYIQLGVAVETVAKYFPVVPWEKENVEIQEWKSEEKDSVDSIIEMLSPETLIDIIRNFLLFRVKFNTATKVLPRYMQYRAANKIVERVLNNL